MKELTKHEAFVAMFYFLHDYWERHDKSEGDVLQILSHMQLWPDNNMPVDLAYWGPRDFPSKKDKNRCSPLIQVVFVFFGGKIPRTLIAENSSCAILMRFKVY